MKTQHVLLLITVALGGFAFTRLQKSPELGVYRTEKTQEAAPADTVACNTISFNARIAPVFYQHCAGCHEGISDYKSVSEHADHILKALKGDGASLMPKDADPLHDTIIQQFSCWIKQGKLNN